MLHELLTGTAEWQAVQARYDEHDAAKTKARAKWEAVQANYRAAVEDAIANAEPVPVAPQVAPWQETEGFYTAKRHELTGQFRTAGAKIAGPVSEALAAREAELVDQVRSLAAGLVPKLAPLLVELRSISETRGELDRSVRLVAVSTGSVSQLSTASVETDALFEMGEAVEAVAGEARVPAARRSRS
ncbi:hypothetical protein [Parafrankia sp. FMc2]|uniref:hypothetical protein n=1 Tax=Parafrankia sp. FMc2 TaxID=3233196 RepID=UPI0034D68214